MYANPDHIRGKRVNLSLNDEEMRVVEAVSALNKMQPSAFLRALIMDSLNGHVHGMNSAVGATEMRAIHS